MRAFTIFLVLAVASSLCSAQWVQTNGPVGQATCFAGNGSNLYVGTIENGVFRSTNGGTSWTAVNVGLTNTGVLALAVDGTNIYAGTDGSGVILSTNNGTNWTQTGLTNGSIGAFAVSGTNVFAGSRAGSVFLSTNSGISWTYSGSTNADIYALAAKGTYLFAATHGGVFVSTNDGTTWTNTGLTSNDVGALAVSGTNLFAGTIDGVFLSTNNGTSWTQTGLTAAIRTFAVSGTSLFAGTSGNVFQSTNNGTSWTQFGLMSTTVYALAVSGANLLAGTGCGVFVSAGSGWITPLFTGATGSGHVTALAVSDLEIFAGITWGGGRVSGGYGFYWGAGIFHSTDNGETWVPQIAEVAQTFARLANDVYAGTWNGVLRSTNNGTSWSPANTGLPYDSLNGYPEVLAFGVFGTNVFAGTSGGGVFLSTNSGTSWSAAGLTNNYVVALAVSGTNVFAGTSGGGVFLSTNNGGGWTQVNTGLTDTRVSALAVLGANLFAGTGYYSGSGGGVFLSTNNGTSWSPANTGLPHDSVLGYYPGIVAFGVSGTNLFAGTFGGGVFLSTNNGTNWATVNTGMTDDLISTLAVGSTHLFAGTGVCELGCYGTGAWKRPLSEMIASVSPAPQLPTAFVLTQNYPNPFNPSTTIRYALTHTSFVTLTVYNTLGQQVAQLVSEQQQAGYHDVVFRGDGLASGVYFYRLVAGSFTSAKKLIVLR